MGSPILQSRAGQRQTLPWAARLWRAGPRQCGRAGNDDWFMANSHRPFGLALSLLAAWPSAAEPLPNFVIIFIDDMGYADIGPFGAKDYPTPNLDRMAQEGRRFTDFYVTQAVCSASRAGLMTGCYNVRVGILGALAHQADHGIHAGEMTLAEVVKQKGYATACFGKWHLGHHPKFLPDQPRLRRVLRPALLERHVAAASRRPARTSPTCR